MNIKNPCASDIDIAEYLDGFLSAAEREAADRYLAEHDGCRSAISAVRAIIRMRDTATGIEPPDHIVRKAVALYHREPGVTDIILSLAERTLAVLRASRDVLLSYPGLVPALRATKPAGTAMVVMAKTFDDLSAEMSIEKLQGSRCNIAVVLCELATGKRARNIHVELSSEGRLLGSGPVDEGRVQFEDVGPGRYDLVIRKRGEESGRMTLKIVA